MRWDERPLQLALNFRHIARLRGSAQSEVLGPDGLSASGKYQRRQGPRRSN
jgi:hypothetical protein